MLQKYVKISAYLSASMVELVDTLDLSSSEILSRVSSNLTASIVNLLVGVEWFRCLKWSIRKAQMGVKRSVRQL